MDVVIRRATPRDATDLAALVDMAGDGLPSHFWSEMAEPGQSPFEFGRDRSMRREGAFSYRNAHIAEIAGAVAGGLIGYAIDGPVDLADIATRHAIAQPIIRLEAQAVGRWYVNVLAVYPEFRGRGIGSRLLAHADGLGRAAATTGMALIVASENIAARRLYERAGYRAAASLPLVAYPGYKHGGDWLLMTKSHC